MAIGCTMQGCKSGLSVNAKTRTWRGANMPQRLDVTIVTYLADLLSPLMSLPLSRGAADLTFILRFLSSSTSSRSSAFSGLCPH